MIDKLEALQYIVKSNPVCDNCIRGNLKEIRIAAGLYQLVKDISSGDQEHFSQAELDNLVQRSTQF